MTEHSSFKDFKNDFYTRVDDLNLFQGKEANYLKVVLDGLKVDYQSRGVIRTTFNKGVLSFFTLRGVKFILSFVKGNLNSFCSKLKHDSNLNKKYWIHDVGRVLTDENQKKKSQYFSLIQNELQDSSIFTSAKKTENLDDYLFCTEDGGSTNGRLMALSLEFVRKDLKFVFNKIQNAEIFTKSELKNIEMAFDLFFENLIYWHKLFDRYKPEKLLFICHYHNEGMIMAAKLLGIEAIEFQHGLIARSDIFYNFPDRISSIREQVLFANKILVYGDYWKELLIEGNAYYKDEIEVIGYYQYHRTQFSSIENDFFSENKIKEYYLVTTQPGLEEGFKKYIKFLSEELIRQKNSKKVIVKLHPSDNFDNYVNFSKDFSNTFIVQNFSLESLINHCFMNITIYSTTVFDALRCGKQSLLIAEPKAIDYVNEMAEETKAQIINFDEFPVISKEDSGSSSYYYGTNSSIKNSSIMS